MEVVCDREEVVSSVAGELKKRHLVDWEEPPKWSISAEDICNCES